MIGMDGKRGRRPRVLPSVQRLLASLLLLLGTACGYARGEAPQAVVCDGMGSAPCGRACCLPALPRACAASTDELADDLGSPARDAPHDERVSTRGDGRGAARARVRSDAPMRRTHRVQHRGADDDAS